MHQIQIKLMHTNEIFDLTRVHNEMKISELKGHIELSTGVSTHIQRVSYLDEGLLFSVFVTQFPLLFLGVRLVNLFT